MKNPKSNFFFVRLEYTLIDSPSRDPFLLHHQFLSRHNALSHEHVGNQLSLDDFELGFILSSEFFLCLTILIHHCTDDSKKMCPTKVFFLINLFRTYCQKGAEKEESLNRWSIFWDK